MNPRSFLFSLSLLLTVLTPVADAAPLEIGNRAMLREISIEQGLLKTIGLRNLLSGRSLADPQGEEFSLTCSTRTADPVRLTAADFEATSSGIFTVNGSQELRVTLSKAGLPVSLEIGYRAKPDEAWMRKDLKITANQDVVIHRIEVERLAVDEAYQPYRANQLTATGHEQWRPPLGQPVYTKTAGFWWGVEFPGARNEVRAGVLSCAYLTRRTLGAGESLASHPVALGVADDADFLKDAFFDYIDATRARPLRLQTQYNSWFDYGSAVSAEKFNASVAKVHQELVAGRGVPPLRAYVIDDGWQDNLADWTDIGVWPVNAKFNANFAESRAAAASANSHLGLWLSPGCLFGAEKAIPRMKAAGWRTLDPWMSMTGGDYMSALEGRMVSLAESGVSYFKLDGIFGHLNKRNFDLAGFQGGETELNGAAFDEAKERYLSLGAERLIGIFRRMAAANPDIYIVISNGAFLSPWWLQSIDAVWMINAGDAAKGSGRSGELVYRDGRYFQLAAPGRDHTQFPLHSIFNHEPKKTDTGESADEFARYLYMNLARGTGFVELYLKTFRLSESDWDVLADGLKWAHRLFPAFKRARMIGGDPAREEVYGYTGWADDLGYVALHNPSDRPATHTFSLDRRSGLTASALRARAAYRISSSLPGDAAGQPATINAGGQITVTLSPKSVRLLEFTREASAARN